MSMKSTSPVITYEPAVIVRCVPTVFDWTRRRLTPCVELPPRVQVPVTIKLPITVRPSVLVAVPVRVKFANVVAPPLLGDITWAPAPLITRDIPLKLLDPEANVAVVPVSVTVAVLAVIVKLETVTRKAVCVVVRVIAEAPIVSVRAFEFELENDPHWHACPFVFNVPAVNVTAPVNVVPAL